LELKDPGAIHRFKFLNDAPLNGSNQDVRVNVLVYEEIKLGTKRNPNPKSQHFAWVADLTLEKSNLMSMALSGDRKNLPHIKSHSGD